MYRHPRWTAGHGRAGGAITVHLFVCYHKNPGRFACQWSPSTSANLKPSRLLNRQLRRRHSRRALPLTEHQRLFSLRTLDSDSRPVALGWDPPHGTSRRQSADGRYRLITADFADVLARVPWLVNFCLFFDICGGSCRVMLLWRYGDQCRDGSGERSQGQTTPASLKLIAAKLRADDLIAVVEGSAGLVYQSQPLGGWSAHASDPYSCVRAAASPKWHWSLGAKVSRSNVSAKSESDMPRRGVRRCALSCWRLRASTRLTPWSTADQRRLEHKLQCARAMADQHIQVLGEAIGGIRLGLIWRFHRSPW